MSSHEPQRQTTPMTTNSHTTITIGAVASRANREESAFPPAPSLKQSSDDGDGDGEQKRKRQRQPRNSACRTCAGLKMKCVASPVPGVVGKCERCHRMQRVCLPAIPKPRKRRAPSGYGGVSPKGSQGIPLADLLDHHTPPEPAFAQAHPAPTRAPVVRSVVKDALLAKQDLFHNGSPSFQSLLLHGLHLEHISEHLVADVDYAFVQTSFTVFRRVSAQFPFLLLRADANVIDMASHRPMTTLAVCIVAAAATPRIQKLLIEAFRLSLSFRLIIAGESNSDLLVGLLTFTAWHHHYASTAQLYQDLYLLAGLATSLGLYRSRFDSRGPSAPDLELQRAFLGSYYLCTGLSIMALGKPSPMRRTENLHQCARTVAQYDHELVNAVGLVEAIYAVELFDSAMRTGPDRGAQPSSGYVDLHVRNALERQKALAREYPQLGATLIFPAISCYLYRCMMMATHTLDIAMLIRCACTLKEYFDDILARDPIILHHAVILDHANLYDNLLLLPRVSSSSSSLLSAGSDERESSSLSFMLRADALITTLHAHVDRANPHDQLAPRSEQNTARFRTVCDAVRHHSSLLAGGPPLATSKPPSARAIDIPEHALGGFRPVNGALSEVPSAVSMRDPVVVAPTLPSREDYAWGILDEAFWRRIAAGRDAAP